MEQLGGAEESLVSLVGMDSDAQNTGSSIHISDVIDVIQMDTERVVNPSGNTMVDSGGGDRRRTSVETAYIKILEQPASKALRFRYECEGRSAGSIPGVNSTPENKTYPTIQVVGYKGRAAVVVSCVTKDPPYRPHPHNLVGKEGCKKGICSLHVSSNNMIVSFSNLGIQCVKKKDIEEALRVREEIRIDPFRTGYAHRNHTTGIDLNAVRLCFQVFLEGPEPNTYTRALTPVVSDPIYDKKAMSDLVICKLSDATASVAGGREMILLCEKVAKEDIQVRFYEERDGQEVWNALADFQPTHVHKQVAISFRTPRYRTIEVEGPVGVYIQLKRPSDGATSEPLPFQLLPLDSGRASFWSLRKAMAKKGNYNTFSQILAADPAMMAPGSTAPGNVPLANVPPDNMSAVAPPTAVPNQPLPEVVDLTEAEQIPVPAASPDVPMEDMKPSMPQMVVTSELLIAPTIQQQDALIGMRQNVEEADYAVVNKWHKLPEVLNQVDDNINMNSILSVSNNNEGEEAAHSLNELINQVGAELDEFYADTKTRLMNQGMIGPDLSPIKMDLQDLQDIDDLQDMYDGASYSSLQMAMKNPIDLMDSYEQVLSSLTSLPPAPPVLVHTPSGTPAKRESPEKLPPLPPKRVKKSPQELLPPPLPPPPAKSLPPPPEIKSLKSPKTTFFSKLFSKKSSPEKKKNMKVVSLSRDNSMRGPSRTSTMGRSNMGASMGNLSRFPDGEDSIFISLRESIDRENPQVQQPIVIPVDQENNNSLMNDVTDVLNGLTETEHLDLYTDMAPRATVSEFDEMSSYYSPVEGGRILMPERGKVALNSQDPVALKRKRQKYGDEPSSAMLRQFQETEKSRPGYTLSPSPDSNPVPLHPIKKEPADASPGMYYGGNLSPMYAAPVPSPQPAPIHSPQLSVGRTPSPFGMVQPYGYAQQPYASAGVGPTPTSIPVRVPSNIYAGGSCTTAPGFSPVHSSQQDLLRPGSAGMVTGIPGGMHSGIPAGIPSGISSGSQPSYHGMVPLNNLSMNLPPGHLSPCEYAGNPPTGSMPPPTGTVNGGLQDYSGVDPAPPGPGPNLVDLDSQFGGLTQLNSGDLCQLGSWDGNLSEQMSSNLTLSESGPSNSCKREAGDGDTPWLSTQH